MMLEYEALRAEYTARVATLTLIPRGERLAALSVCDDLFDQAEIVLMNAVVHKKKHRCESFRAIPAFSMHF